MRHIHVRSLEKYQPGYKDRRHIWAKIYAEMLQGDEDAEMLGEIEWSRLVKLIVLETCRGKSTPADERFLNKRGFDFGLQSLETTLKYLTHFIEIVDVTESENSVTESSPRLEKKRIEKIREEKHTHGETGLVSLTQEEHKKLLVKLGERQTADYITRLENYIGSKGKKYKSHYHTILSWAANPKSGESENPLNLNKTQSKSLEALDDFARRRTAGPENLHAGDGQARKCIPGA